MRCHPFDICDFHVLGLWHGLNAAFEHLWGILCDGSRECPSVPQESVQLCRVRWCSSFVTTVVFLLSSLVLCRCSEPCKNDLLGTQSPSIEFVVGKVCCFPIAYFVSWHISIVPTSLFRVPHVGENAAWCGRCLVVWSMRPSSAFATARRRLNQSCIDPRVGKCGKWHGMCEHTRGNTLATSGRELDSWINAWRTTLQAPKPSLRIQLLVSCVS